MKWLVLLCFILFASARQFRTDYEFNKKTDAFYKLHIESVSNLAAKRLCAVEGATLMLPKSELDVSVVHGLLKQYPDIGEYVWIDNDGLSHESAEEQPMIDLNQDAEPWFSARTSNCDVINRAGEIKTYICRGDFPFICKIEAKNVFYDSHCKVYSKGYQYYPSVGSCYKIPDAAFSWNHAYDHCRAEGSHLVVLSSEAESLLIKNITHSAPPVPAATTSWFFFAGIRAPKTDSPIIFKTIFNQTLEEAGFSQWSPNEPNNAGNNEYCGSIFKSDGKYNDLNCWHNYGFICEQEI